MTQADNRFYRLGGNAKVEPDPEVLDATIRPDGDLAPLYSALSKAQAEITNAKRTQENPFLKARGQKSKYADLADTWEACRAALTKNGLSVIQMPTSDGNKITVRTILAHESGASIASDLSMSSKEDDPQTIGKLISYARRYALQAFVGIAAEDDDGNAASGDKLDPSKTAAETKEQPRERNGGKKKNEVWALVWENPTGSNSWFTLDQVAGLDKAKKRADELAKEKESKIYVTLPDSGQTEYIAEPGEPVVKASGSEQKAEATNDDARLAKVKMSIDNAKVLIGGSNLSAGKELANFFTGYFGTVRVPRLEAALDQYEQAMPKVMAVLEDPKLLDRFKKDARGLGIELGGNVKGDDLDKEFDIWNWDPETRAVARKLYAARNMESASDFRNYMMAIRADQVPAEDARALMRVSLVTRNAYKILPVAASLKMPLHQVVAWLEKQVPLEQNGDSSLQDKVDYAIENLAAKIRA